MSDTEKNFEEKANEIAEWNIKNQNFMTDDIKSFGGYEVPQVPAEKQELIRQEFDTLKRIVWPTLIKLNLEQNYKDINDRIFNRLMWYTSEANRCIRLARNYQEADVCSDHYLDNLRNRLRPEVVQIMREY